MRCSRRPLLIAGLGLALGPPLALALSDLRGSGNATTQRRDIGMFTGLSLAAPFAVVLRPASRESIEIVADDNIVPLIDTRLRGSGTSQTVQIGLPQGLRIDPRAPIVVTVDYVRLSALSLAGADKISGSALKAGKLDASIGGSGSLSLPGLEADELAVSIGGSGVFGGFGRVRKFALAIGGSGRCEAEDLVAGDVSVTIAGSGSARVHAETALHASIVGSGELFYRGAPALHTSSIGNGRGQRI
jgi:hypothetical protein